MCIPGSAGAPATAAAGGRSPRPRDVRDDGGMRRVDGGHFCRGTAGPCPGDAWSSSVKKILTMAAAIGFASLTACSVSTPDPNAASTAPPAPEQSRANSPRTTASAGSATDAPPSSAAGEAAAGGAAAGGAKGTCELFNELVAEYKAVPADDPDGFEDIYLRAQDAKDVTAGDLQGLFASLSLLAIDRSAAAESGGVPAQESQDAVRDAVFANAGTCTAEGVTLRL
jgi:hypothetical protein